MLFAIVLGTLIGGAGATLLRQWASDAMSTGSIEAREPVLTAAAFPRLAPPERLTRGLRHGQPQWPQWRSAA